MATGRQAAAWGVHLFTASGGVASLLAMLAIGDGRWHAALVWMAAAMVVDSFDGMLARSVDAGRVLPHFDGALLDNMVDYLGYVAVPAYFLVESRLLPADTALPAAAAVLLASSYQFAHHEAKTADHFFTGFPSFWNVAVLYLYYGGLAPGINLAVIGLLALGVFLPLRWLYPSRMTRFRGPTLAVTLAWGASVAAILVLDPPAGSTLVAASAAYVAFYVVVSLWLGGPAPGSDSR